LELSKLRQRKRAAAIKANPDAYILFRNRTNFDRRARRLKHRALETKRNRRYYDKVMNNPVKRKAVKEYRQRHHQEKMAKLKANPAVYKRYLAQKNERRRQYDKGRIKEVSHCYYLQIKNDPVAYKALQKKTHDLYLKRKQRLQEDPAVWKAYLENRKIRRRVNDIFRKEGQYA
jgi:hypothetical protein